jgi:DNA polymerase-3 subunit epsilon
MTNIFSEPLVFCDLETTGANFINDRIIEIGLIQVDESGVHEWSALVNPGTSISPFITGLTGIDTVMVASAPTFEQLAPLVAEKLRGRLFIAHNARFDYGFLKREFKRLGIDFRMPSLCTVKLSRKLFPEHHRHNLDTLVERHRLKVGERHRALADARVLWDLWQHWHEVLPIKIIHQAVAVIIGRPELPPQLDNALIDDLPETLGAYALYSENGEILHVKRSANIRQQVLALFAVERRESALARNTWRIEWQETAGELGARLREIEFLGKHRKPVDELCSWQLAPHAKDDFRPGLVFARDLDFGVAGNLFGLYKSRQEAINALRKLADVHRLCYLQLGIDGAGHGNPCTAYTQKICRGTCIGKEALSLHSARLMTALAKFQLKAWPYRGPVGLLESDEFGMRTDFHLIDRWRYLGTVHNEQALAERMECPENIAFDPDIYRMLNKFFQAGKIRVITLPPLL